jgi:hypothetical protein
MIPDGPVGRYPLGIAAYLAWPYQRTAEASRSRASYAHVALIGYCGIGAAPPSARFSRPVRSTTMASGSLTTRS